MQLIQQNKLVVFIIILVVADFGVVAFIKSNYKDPFDGEITSIVLNQNVEPHSIDVNNKDEFLDKMNLKEWKELDKFELKSAPIYYITLKPSNDVIEIFSHDDENAYACFEHQYYTFPIDSYEYIEKIMQDNK